MDLEQHRILMKAFVTSQFSYFPLILVFHSRTMCYRINKIDKRTLIFVYQSNKISFTDLLDQDSSVTTYQRNQQVLVTEIFIAKYRLAPEIIKEVF